jgi:hypothetical protein
MFIEKFQYPSWTKTFNSLFRDHVVARYAPALEFMLSTPSLGITEDAAEEISGHFSYLSTPSLGITEPDSGIFRLSAAFCRGTPSHK